MRGAETPSWLGEDRRWEERLDLIEALITDTSLDDGLPWRRRWSTRDQTDRFRAFLRSPDSRESIALAHAYLALTDSSVRPPSSLVASCLPTWTGPSGLTRAFTLSIGIREVAFAWLDRRDGTLQTLGLTLNQGAQLSNLPRDCEHLSDDQHQDLVLAYSTAAARLLLANASVIEAMRGRSADLSARTPTRRIAWSNPHLEDLLTRLQEPTSDLGHPPVEAAGENLGPVTVPPPPADSEWSVARDYVLAQVRRRRHQQKARRLLLQQGDATCSYCGLDRIEILDAAHLVPDSKGGEASSQNMRLLCKNHHAAQEIGLLLHRPTDDTWYWKDGVQRF